MAKKLDQQDLSEDEAFAMVVKQRYSTISIRAKKTWMFFILTVIAATPFMAPFPLNLYWRPWGQRVLLVCGFAFFMTVLNTAFWWSEWHTRRKMEKESEADTKR